MPFHRNTPDLLRQAGRQHRRFPHLWRWLLGAITFSEKEEPFEGIKEKFCAHKGNCLITMEDFQRMTVEVRIANEFTATSSVITVTATTSSGSFDNAMQQWPYDREQQIARIANTAVLFLKTKEALERKQPLVVYPIKERRQIATQLNTPANS